MTEKEKEIKERIERISNPEIKKYFVSGYFENLTRLLLQILKDRYELDKPFLSLEMNQIKGLPLFLSAKQIRQAHNQLSDLYWNKIASVMREYLDVLKTIIYKNPKHYNNPRPECKKLLKFIENDSKFLKNFWKQNHIYSYVIHVYNPVKFENKLEEYNEKLVKWGNVFPSLDFKTVREEIIKVVVWCIKIVFDWDDSEIAYLQDESPLLRVINALMLLSNKD